MSIFLPLLVASAELLRVHSPKPLQAEAAAAAFEPWETPIAGFFVRSHHGVPSADPARWTITIDGLVDHPLTLTLKDLSRRQVQSLHAVLECSGNGRALQTPHASGVQWLKGAVGNAAWSGYALADLLSEAGVQSSARFARLEGADAPPLPATPAFVRSVPLEKLRAPGSLLATMMNGTPLPLLHGGPVRLVLPNWYGENWTKWVTRITLTATEDEGFFMKKAYRIPKQPVKPGEPWDSATGRPIEQLLVQSLITSPPSDASVRAGVVAVRGKAFSGAGSIVKVELSANDGATWQAANLAPPRADGGWQEFSSTVTLTVGKTSLLARATDASGAIQPLEHTWNPGGYVRNAADRVAITVIGASDDPAPLASDVLRDKCFKCHAAQLITAQRLSAAGWDKTLAKMEAFGVQLTSLERSSLLAYLSQVTPELALDRPADLNYDRAAAAAARRATGSKATAKSGAKLYASVCAACHGSAGEGSIGPRLAGRLPPYEDFQAIVQFGQRSMPAFASTYSAAQIDSVYQYIERR